MTDKSIDFLDVPFRKIFIFNLSFTEQVQKKSHSKLHKIILCSSRWRLRTAKNQSNLQLPR